jgi:arsenate-mycothiol transferase
MRKISGDSVHVYSAGTKPGDSINVLSAESLAEVGVDISDETPKPIDAQLIRDVDFVITLGRETHVEPVPGPRCENWDTDEPSERGIHGIERMRLVRPDSAKRVADLLSRVQAQSG